MPRPRRPTMSISYAAASTGQKAREEISRILRAFGCEFIGFMDNFDDHSVLLAFTHRGRQLQLRASAKGWAALYLKKQPWNGNRRSLRQNYEQAVLRQGHIAVNSILRDWIKGQVTAVECGILSFEAVFLPFILDVSGRPMLDRVIELLPKPEDRVVALPGQ